MKTRILSILTALCLCLTLLPTAALADGESSSTTPTGTVLTNGTTSISGGTEESPQKCYLNSDVTISSTLQISGYATLDLNGHVLEYNGTGRGSVIKVASGGHLTLTDTSTTNNTHYFDVNSTTGLWTLSDSETANIITGGVITGGTGTIETSTGNAKGGGVYVESNGTFTMKGGHIVGCAARPAVYGGVANGGGVYVESNATFTMSGGSIRGCTAIGVSSNGGSGGGVYVTANGTFKMNSGVIADCTAKGGNGAHTSGNGSGGGVYVRGTFTMNGGTIVRCTADGGSGTDSSGSGGGVYANGRFTMNGGSITSCTASSGGTTGSTAADTGSGNGGGVYVGCDTGKECNLTGGTVSSNTATDSGGGVYVGKDNTLTVGGGDTALTITGNTRGSTTPATADNVYLDSEGNNTAKLTVADGGLTAGSQISVGTGADENTVLLDESCTDYLSCFVSDRNGYGFSSDGTLVEIYTVTFNSNGGSAVDEQKVLKGQKATEPGIPPTNGDCVFGGWYKDAECNTAWNFMDDTVTGSITLYAKWLKNINSLNITLTIDDAEKSWDGATVTYNGREHTLTVTVKDGETTLTAGTDYTVTGDTTGTNAGNYPLVISGIGAYAESKDGGWAISLAPVTVKADDITVYVGDAMPTLTYTATGLIGSDTLGDAVTLSCTADTNTAGTYEITASGTAVVGNYTVTYQPGTLTVKTRSSGASTPTYSVTAPTAANGTVTVSPKNASKGTTVTVTVTPDSGYTLETLTVLDKNGNALELIDKGNGKYTFKMPAGKVSIEASFMDDNTMLNFFTDVPADAYYYDAVMWAARNGITGGIDENHFGPGLSCARAQLVTFLWRAAGCPVVDYAMNFTDVGDGYYTEAVRWAASLGIVGGYGNGLFGTGDTITREQFVTILYRFARAMGMDTSVGEDTNILSYNDVSEVSEYAVEAMQWAVGADIVQGNDGNLMPGQPCTRAQIVTMLYRLLGE